MSKKASSSTSSTNTSSESKLAFTSSEAIKKMADGIISDKKNTNNLVKLTEFLETLFPLSSQKHRKLALQTIVSLVDVFSKFFEGGTLILTVTESKDQKDVVACDVSKEKSIQKKEYMKWIYEQYCAFTKYLPLYAVHYFTKFEENYEEIEAVIKAVLDLSKKELTSASGSTLVEMERERNRINTIINEGPFGSLIYHLIYDSNNNEGKDFVLTYLKEYIYKFHDLRFFTYITLTNAIRKIRSKKKRMITYPQLYDNVLAIVDGIPIIDVIGRFYLYDGYDYDSDEVNSDEEDGMDEDLPEDGIPDDFMMDPELGDLSSLTLPSSQKQSTKTTEKKETEEKEDEEMKDEEKENSLLDADMHINAYTNFWLAFLQIPEMTRAVYEKVLRKMSTEIIPQFEDPFLLNDFISNSFDQGGLVALLSVKSLFILITEYNLVYDQFYNKIYAIIEPSLFTMDDRHEFFELLDTFMKSTHLPEYLVAAFVKKLARISLFAPAYACNYILAVIYNLVSRHPQISFLVQKGEVEPRYLSRLQKKHLMEKNPEIYLSDNRKIVDPFDLNEKDPKECKAMQSQLWEIETLLHHSNAEVAKFARDIKRHFLEGFPQHDIKKYSVITTETMFETISVKKKFVKLSGIEPPKSLFGGDHNVFGQFNL